MSDPAKYRSKDELNRMRQEHDPIDQMKRRLIEEDVADEAKLKEWDRQVKDIITAAAEFAQSSPEPDPAELYTDVYVEA
jgi:pyruvate dehydrogenase E1 component alpha subunit